MAKKSNVMWICRLPFTSGAAFPMSFVGSLPTYSTAPSLGQLKLQCAVEGGHSIGCVDQSGEGMWFAQAGHWLKRDSPEGRA